MTEVQPELIICYLELKFNTYDNSEPYYFDADSVMSLGRTRTCPSASTCSVEEKTSGASACHTYGLSAELFIVNLTLRSFAPVAADPGFKLYATSQ